jgi:hypothetical protein
VGFYIYSDFLFFFLYYQLHHHNLLIPILTPFTLSPSPVLQSIVLLLNYFFWNFSSMPLPSPPLSILPQPVTTLPVPPTYSPPADQPIVPTLHTTPNLLQSLTQAPYTTTTEIYPKPHKGHKT